MGGIDDNDKDKRRRPAASAGRSWKEKAVAVVALTIFAFVYLSYRMSNSVDAGNLNLRLVEGPLVAASVTAADSSSSSDTGLGEAPIGDGASANPKEVLVAMEPSGWYRAASLSRRHACAPIDGISAPDALQTQSQSSETRSAPMQRGRSKLRHRKRPQRRPTASPPTALLLRRPSATSRRCAPWRRRGTTRQRSRSTRASRRRAVTRAGRPSRSSERACRAECDCDGRPAACASPSKVRCAYHSVTRALQCTKRRR
jgi:hypothetical protein